MPEWIRLQSEHLIPITRRALVVISTSVGRTNMLLLSGPTDELLSVALGFLATLEEKKMGAI